MRWKCQVWFKILRLLHTNPTFAITAMLTLGIGIAINTTVFGWIDNLFLRPIPGAAAAHELVSVEEISATGQATGCPHPDYRDFQRDANLLSELAAWHFLPFTVGSDRDAQRVYGQVVSANFFSVLGIEPVIGRTFAPGEDRDIPAAYPYAVISERLWRTRFQPTRPCWVGRFALTGNRLRSSVLRPANSMERQLDWTSLYGSISA